jgi:tetratricopeptide (TPR) repeat protein
MVLGGAVLAVLAVFAIAALMRPVDQPISQRIAFFGFAPGNADPLAMDIAAAATDETFQALLALRLEAASRAETQGVELPKQRARAAELGAAYALGGDVRPADGVISIHMYLEDVASRTTLWEQTVSGGAAEKMSLPVLAAGAVTRVARCMAGARPSLPRQDGDVLAQLATACATPFIAYREALPQWRALASQAPDSAVIQANLANSLIYHANHSGVKDAELAEVWRDASAAAQRALVLEPDNGVAQTVLAYNAIFEGQPLAKAGELMDAAVRKSPDDWRRGETGSNRSEFLRGVGRVNESLAAAQAVIDRDPLSPTPYSVLSHALVNLGRGAEAGRVLEQLNARWPDAWWTDWAGYAVRYQVSDMEVVLAAAPPRVTEDSKTCWRELAKAYASDNPAIRRAGADTIVKCGADGRFDANASGRTRARLMGDLKGVLASYGPSLNRSHPSFFLGNTAVLLSRGERALRAEPQFLPMMKKSGLYQYWLDTGTHPDICDLPEEKSSEVCSSLRADQASKP